MELIKYWYYFCATKCMEIMVKKYLGLLIWLTLGFASCKSSNQIVAQEQDQRVKAETKTLDPSVSKQFEQSEKISPQKSSVAKRKYSSGNLSGKSEKPKK